MIFRRNTVLGEAWINCVLCVFHGHASYYFCHSLRFIYETEHFNGVAELLEILGRWALMFADGDRSITVEMIWLWLLSVRIHMFISNVLAFTFRTYFTSCSWKSTFWAPFFDNFTVKQRWILPKISNWSCQSRFVWWHWGPPQVTFPPSFLFWSSFMSFFHPKNPKCSQPCSDLVVPGFPFQHCPVFFTLQYHQWVCVASEGRAQAVPYEGAHPTAHS